MIGSPQKFSRLLAAVLFALCLIGCGGSGSSKPTPTPVVAPNPTISASSSGGLFNQSQQVTLSSNGATIYFTTDGSAPTAGAQRYTGALTLENDTTLKAVAMNGAGQSSSTLTLNFEFDYEAPADFALKALTGVINNSNAAAFALTIIRGEVNASYSVEINDTDRLTEAVRLSGQISNADGQDLSADLLTLVDGDLTAVLILTDAAGNVSMPFELALTKAASATGVQITGAASVSSGTQIDSDVNESSVINVGNNDFASAQKIFSPGVLGGYVNQPNSGEPGNLYASGDVSDYFRVSLSAGESILLTISDTAEGQDLDMELYDASRVLVDDSVSTGNTESVQAAASGEFYVRVFAFSGASNYALTLGASSAAFVGGARTESLSSFDAFVPNQVIVELGEKSDSAMS